jgi:hypothetical protein
VVGAILAVLVRAHLSFTHKVQQEIRELFARADTSPGPVVTADMLRDLPAPVQRYLTYSGIVGKPMVRTIRLRQSGRIRGGVEQPWQAFEAQEYYSVNPPSFIWVATIRAAGLPLVRARDRYERGRGNMWIMLGSLSKIADARGPEIDQGTMLRYLQEVTWFPSAFLGENMTWKAIDDASADVTFTDGGKSVSGTLYVDAEGKLTNFVAQRYRTSGASYEMDTWTTPTTEFGEMAGLRLGIRGQGVWKLASGDLPYIDVQLTALEFDPAESY